MTTRIDPHTAEPGFYWARDHDGEWTIVQLREGDGFLVLGSDLYLTAGEVAEDWEIVQLIEAPDSEIA